MKKKTGKIEISIKGLGITINHKIEVSDTGLLAYDKPEDFAYALVYFNFPCFRDFARFFIKKVKDASKK